MKWSNDQIEHFRQAALFFQLDDDQLASILESAQYRSLGSGELLFSQGDKAEHFFWLECGLMKLYRLSPAGEEKVIEIVKPGQTFAEALMFMDKQGRFPVNAEMIDKGSVVCVPNRVFLEVLRGSVDTCFRLMAGMSQRLHQHVKEIDRLTLQTAMDRVINYLLQDMDVETEQVQLLTAKQTLAAQLSIKPETLSRAFSKLSKEGLIEISSKQIRLLDIEALRQRVEV